ncbi:alpha/beta hydrolase [Streptomyces sp. NPDC088387]|uniref:alpha/beta hydrolase n=1 Tax=Streptomyces sp. NPDC088387 TaxID=3365859 RepID=UPI0037F7D1C0
MELTGGRGSGGRGSGRRDRRWRDGGREDRRGAGRRRRTLLAALITTCLVVPLSAAARPTVPAPDPARLGRVTATTLDAAYAANRANAAEASRMAADHGDSGRADVERAMADDPSRQLLAFDGRGAGRATEVFGDLARADRIGVLIPGSDTGLDTYGRFRAAAEALHRQLAHEAPGTPTAVVAWLGYETPGTVSTTVMTTDRADEAAPELREFIGRLRVVTGEDAQVALVCHSYGSVVCARAASGLDVEDLVVVGSPGTGVDSAADLDTPARIWAGRGAGDWVADVPHLRADLFGTTVGFGTDPMSPAYGARRFAAGSGGHSDYFTPGSVALANLARIVLGETSEVGRD